jgi:hypothetical protein
MKTSLVSRYYVCSQLCLIYFSSAANHDYNEAPEDLDDDVPVNLDYLADALGPISTSSDKKKRALRGASYGTNRQRQIISDIDGETIQMLDSRGLRISDDYLVVPLVNYEEYKRVSHAFNKARLIFFFVC